MPQRSIGILNPYLTGPFSAEVFDGIRRTVVPQGYRMIAIQLPPASVADQRMGYDQIDGWIALTNIEGLGSLVALGRPVVIISGIAPGTGCTSVLPDNRGGARAAVEHLLGHGHTQIAFVGYMENPDFQERHSEYARTLQAHGIAPHPALFQDSGGHNGEHGRAAVERLLATGVPFSAVFVTSDSLARGVILGLQRAGHQVPGDVAVIGFDDIADAQNTNPPLTTVRQRFDTLGQYAAETLLRQIGGDHGGPQTIFVPTSLVVRRSCGCSGEPPAPHRSEHTHWQQGLIADLIQRAIHPLPYDPAAASDDIWAEVGAVVAGLEAVLDGAAAPNLWEAWVSVSHLTSDVQTLYHLGEILGAAAEEQIIIRGNDATARARVAAFVAQSQAGMLNAYHQRNTARSGVYRSLLEAENLVMQTLLNDGTVNLDALNWLAPTTMDWAMLFLWDDATSDQKPTLRIRSTYMRESGFTFPIGPVHLPTFPPLAKLSAATQEITTCVKVLPIHTHSHNWGLFVYSEPNATADYDSAATWVALLGITLERERLLGAVNENQTTLRVAYDQARALADTIQELGCPLLPLLPGVLLVPLVGAIDQRRAQLIVERVLEGVSSAQAQHVLLDITGVPLVDTQVASALIQTAQAVRLLGARLTLVGVRPEIAQSIISLGVDLGSIETRPTLAAATRALLAR